MSKSPVTIRLTVEEEQKIYEYQKYYSLTKGVIPTRSAVIRDMIRNSKLSMEVVDEHI